MFAGIFLGQVFRHVLDSLMTFERRLLYFRLSLRKAVERSLLEVWKILLLLDNIICLGKVPVVAFIWAYLRRN